MRRLLVILAAGAVASAAPAGELAAQVPNASTPALGMARNFTAAARGYGALAWNPALLASARNGNASMTLLTVATGVGLGPVGLSDLAAYDDRLVPDATKTAWLDRIRGAGGERGTADADATWGAAQVGRFGVQVASSVRTLADLSPDVVRFILFGNADDAGNPAILDFSGSSVDLAAFTTFAGGYAHPFAVAPGMRLLAGLTVSYTIGHVLATSAESAGGAGVNSFAIDFPLITSQLDPDSIDLSNGGGFGLDLGVALEAGAWTVSAAVRNAVNGFSWDVDELRYRPFRIAGSTAELVAETEERPLAEASDALRAHVAGLDFKPTFALGAAYRPQDRLLVSADLRRTTAGGIGTAERLHVGAGAEYYATEWLPLRAGAAVVTVGEDNTGFQLGGGVGVNLGGWNLGASAMLRDTQRFDSETVLMATVFATGLP